MATMLDLLNDYSSKAQEIINRSPEAQKMMDVLAKKAEEKNLSQEDWNKVKKAVFENALIYCMMRDNKFLEEVGTALYHELRAN